MKAYYLLTRKYLAEVAWPLGGAGGGQQCGSNLNILLATFQEAIELKFIRAVGKRLANLPHRNQRLSPQNQKLNQAYLSRSAGAQDLPLPLGDLLCGAITLPKWHASGEVRAPLALLRTTNYSSGSASSRPPKNKCDQTPYVVLVQASRAYEKNNMARCQH
jgi:hypothetical protein